MLRRRLRAEHVDGSRVRSPGISLTECSCNRSKYRWCPYGVLAGLPDYTRVAEVAADQFPVSACDGYHLEVADSPTEGNVAHCAIVVAHAGAGRVRSEACLKPGAAAKRIKRQIAQMMVVLDDR